jgi:hypothetical protein
VTVLNRNAAAVLLIQLLAAAEVVRFDQGVPGTLPAGWTAAMTHQGGAPQWQILKDGSRMVLAQISRDRTAGRFPLAIWDAAFQRNGEVSVEFKSVSGEVDQAAGVVWRYQDPNNYYIVRANALEDNVVLYKVERGVRVSIAPKGLPSRAYGVKHAVPKGRWNKLSVAFEDSRITVFLNGERLFEAEDSAITKAGKTGLWTKADSVTYFDQFTVNGK